MLYGQQNITKTRLFRNADPLIAIQILRIITLCRNRAIRPLRLAKSIDSKMNEHTILPFLHFFLSQVRMV